MLTNCFTSSETVGSKCYAYSPNGEWLAYAMNNWSVSYCTCVQDQQLTLRAVLRSFLPILHHRLL